MYFFLFFLSADFLILEIKINRRMLEKFLELSDILLYPAEFNSGSRNRNRYNFGVLDDLDNTASLPIFTTPNSSIIDKTNWETFNKTGIKSILPLTEDLGIRLDGCQYIFAAFTLDEVKNNFLVNRKNTTGIFRICIENDRNGQDTEIFNVATSLRKIYGNQVNIMAGNLGNPQTYISYCKAGINYVRVGISSDSAADPDVNGFYYPMASLLLDIIGVQKTTCMGLKHTKIIADGGISSPIDIIKAIALGADYVMIGSEFAKLVDSAGSIYSKNKTDAGDKYEEISRGSLLDVPVSDLKGMNLKRLYGSSYSDERKRGTWLVVDNTLANWTKEMYYVFYNAFDLAGALTWKEYKDKIKLCRIS